MTATVAGIHLGIDTHANRPAANTVPDGSVYSCSTHGLIYKSNYGGNSWATWATLGAGASGSITASGYTQNTARLLGRTTASAGAIEEITVGSGLSLSAGSLTATGGGTRSIVRKTADETVSASTSLQDDNHLIFAIGASEVWFVTYYLFVNANSDAGDFKFDITVPAAATTRQAIMGAATNASSNESSFRQQSHTTGNALGAGVVNSATIDSTIIAFAYIVNSTNAGNVTFRWAQLNASGTTTLLAGSTLVAEKIA